MFQIVFLCILLISVTLNLNQIPLKYDQIITPLICSLEPTLKLFRQLVFKLLQERTNFYVFYWIQWPWTSISSPPKLISSLSLPKARLGQFWSWYINRFLSYRENEHGMDGRTTRKHNASGTTYGGRRHN